MAGRPQLSGRAFSPFFRVLGNTKSLYGARQMVRYVAFGSRDLMDRAKGGFDRDHDQANVKQFARDLQDPLTRHARAAKAFHCIFSLSQEQYDRCGLQEWRSVVREVMQTYERESGRRLSWFAAQHPNPTHPHCHVIIKGVYETTEGNRRKLWMSRTDLKQFRQITGRVLGYHRTQVRAMERAAQPQRDLSRSMSAFTTGLAWIQEQIRKERLRRAEQDRAHRNWLHDHDERDRWG